MTSPEMQSSLTGREGLRQKESITLPDGQVLEVRGKKQIRTLRLLITAFNQDKPYVHNKELLGFNTISRLRHKTLIESGWTIKSITVNGKGVEKRPKGYTLIKDQAQKVDTPTSYLQNILDNKTVLTELAISGPGKTSILEKAEQQINSFDPQEKIIFLEKTFAILSDPNSGHQNERDAALELLSIMDLKSIDPKELTKTYTKAVSNLREDLNQDSDPYGEIHMLLEAGKIIAPFKNRSGHINRAWNRVAKAFTGDDRQKILDDIKEIRQLIPTKFPEFDKNVAKFVKEGLSNEEIAEKLGVIIQEVGRSIRRLRKKGMRPNRQTGKKRTIQRKQLFKDVKDLRSKGMGNLEIANELETPIKTIGNIAYELIGKGEIQRIKNSRLKKKV